MNAEPGKAKLADPKDIANKLDELRALLGDSEPVIQPTIEELWVSWSKGMSLTKSKATADSIKNSSKHLLPIIREKHLNEITNELWVNEILPTIIRQTHVGFKHANNKKWLSCLLKWAEENNKGPIGWRHPKLMDPDPEIVSGKCYSIEETDALLAHADWLLKPKIVMALEMFMRRSEIALLSKDRVDRVNRIIHLRAQDCKTRHARSFPYTENLEMLFKIMDSKLPQSSWVFPSPHNPSRSIGRDGFATSWSSCKRHAGIKGRFHDLRHSALTRAFKSGKNPALICEMAGLNIAIAQATYLHWTVDDLREVIK